LRTSGDLVPATAGFDTLPEPLALPEGYEKPSEILARLRRDER